MEQLKELEKRLHRRKLDIIHRGLRELPQDYKDLQKQIDDLKKSLSEQNTPLQQQSIFNADEKVKEQKETPSVQLKKDTGV
jgi:hypothetical protein